VRKIHNIFCTSFLSDLYVKSARSYVRPIVKQYKVTKTVMGLCSTGTCFTFFFQNHLGLGRSPLLKACEQCPKELTAGKEIGTQNREKNAITHTLSQIPGYATVYQCNVRSSFHETHIISPPNAMACVSKYLNLHSTSCTTAMKCLGQQNAICCPNDDDRESAGGVHPSASPSRLHSRTGCHCGPFCWL